MITEYSWDPVKVLDDRGEISHVRFSKRYDTKHFTDKQTSIRVLITLPCGDGYATNLPVFTEWFQ